MARGRNVGMIMTHNYCLPKKLRSTSDHARAPVMIMIVRGVARAARSNLHGPAGMVVSPIPRYCTYQPITTNGFQIIPRVPGSRWRIGKRATSGIVTVRPG